MVDTSDLNIFAAVVAENSLTAAGKSLGMSPALISKRIRRLEEHLGARLLQRTTRQISLTDAGRGYHERVIDILAGLEEAESYLLNRSKSATGTLKISAPTGFGRAHIAPHLEKFLHANPKLSTNLVLSDRIVDVVGEGFDIAIRIGSLADSSLVVRKLAPLRRVLCASPVYLEKSGVPNSLDELSDHFCVATHSQSVWKMEGPSGPVNYRVDSRFQTNSSDAVTEAARSGMGIALRSTWDIGPELANGNLRIVLPHYTGSSRDAICALYPTRNFLPAKVRVFLEYLSELYGPEPYWDHGLRSSSKLQAVFQIPQPG